MANKLKILFALVGVLLVVSGVLTYQVFMKPNHLPIPKREGAIKELIVTQLQFSKEQVQRYELLIEEHRKGIRKHDKQIRENKRALYEGIGENSEEQIAEKIAAINQAQKEIEWVHYHHFQEIEKLCTAQQKPDFQKLKSELVHLFAPGRHPKGPPPHR